MEWFRALDRAAWHCSSKYASVCDFESSQTGEAKIPSYEPLECTPEVAQWCVVSGLLGGIIGILTSLAVNTVLVEVSMSPTFATYFGICVVFTGAVIIWRAAAGNPYAHPDEVKATKATRRLLYTFATINVMSGVLCLFTDTSALLSRNFLSRLLAFSVLGISASFALTFGVVDLLNLVVGFTRPQDSRPLLESALQIYVVLGTSIIMGLIFGSLFGAVGRASNVAVALARRFAVKQGLYTAHVISPSLCYPIGFLCGGLGGVACVYVRRLEARLHRVNQPVEFDGDI